MNRLLAILIASTATLASATTLTRDYSDLWYNPAESGWGANMIQQGEIIFLTMFVYGNNTQPIWYVASDLTLQPGAAHRFTGQIYQTSGPYFGAPIFNPNSVTVTPVGTATFIANSATTGTLAYTINTVSVTKNVTRQTWRTENLTGVYQGATIGTYVGCSSGNGPYDSTASFTVNQSGTNINITEFGAGYQCNYTGFVTPSGRMGTITGTGSCTPGGAAEIFTASEVQSTPEVLSARMESSAGACRFSGRFGGLRRQ